MYCFSVDLISDVILQLFLACQCLSNESAYRTAAALLPVTMEMLSNDCRKEACVKFYKCPVFSCTSDGRTDA